LLIDTAGQMRVVIHPAADLHSYCIFSYEKCRSVSRAMQTWNHPHCDHSATVM